MGHSKRKFIVPAKDRPIPTDTDSQNSIDQWPEYSSNSSIGTTLNKVS